ncbi:pectinesterase [Sarracenia purpurea var. burkii]
MAGKTMPVATATTVLMILLAIPTVISAGSGPFIPYDKSQLNAWFKEYVTPVASRTQALDPALVAAEGGAKIIKVRQDGSGDFKTVTDAVNSIPNGNTNRVIVWIGGGNYTEKVKIDRSKPFVTFYGSPNNMPTLVFHGTAAQYGTWDSASLIVESDYFTAANVKIMNSSPMPVGRAGQVNGGQAVALRISGEKASFYNTRIYGFQDTLCDDSGKHFFKDCYIEGLADFIFGNGKSMYLSTEIHVVPVPASMVWGVITAHGGKSAAEDTGYSFVHCRVTGTGKNTYLGRAWMAYPKVVFAHTDMSDVINPLGWSDNFRPQNDK